MRVEILTSEELPRFSRMPCTTAQLAGLCYERAVTAWLAKAYQFYPQIAFRANGNIIIPDGLLNWCGEWVVVEIKTRACSSGLFQLKTYQTVLARWFRRPVGGLLITAHYDTLPGLRPAAGATAPFVDLSSCYCLPLSTRELRTRGWGYDELGLGEPTSYAAVRPDGSAGNGTDCIQRVSRLEPAS